MYMYMYPAGVARALKIGDDSGPELHLSPQGGDGTCRVGDDDAEAAVVSGSTSATCTLESECAT